MRAADVIVIGGGMWLPAVRRISFVLQPSATLTLA